VKTTSDNIDIAPASPKEIRTVVTGLILALMLASLDQNIVGVALPRIVSDLGGLKHISWVVTAFMVTSTATTPLYGKLSDMYGRKPLFIGAIFIFLAGSILCGLSRSMAQLVLFRGIQGAGAGGLMTLAMTTIADLVPPRERGRYQGFFGATFAFSSIAGPLLGGFITSALSWHWIFFVNLPIGLLALAFFIFGFHRVHHKVVHRIDYAGVFYLTFSTVSLLLVLSMGGVQYPWSSPIIAGLCVFVAVMVALLISNERGSAEPIFPPDLFRNRVFVIATGTMAITFMGLFGAAVFLPLFFQLVLGYAPAKAGLLMAPMTVGVVISSFTGGRLVTRTGKYKRYPVIGLAAASLSFLFIMTASSLKLGIGLIEISLVILGLGFGLVMPNLMVAIQNAVNPLKIGAATATSAYFRSLGGTFGVALSGAIMSVQLHGVQASTLPQTGSRALILEQGIQEILQLSPERRDAVIAIYRYAINTTFLVGAIITALAFLLVLNLPELPLRSGRPSAEG